MPFHFGTTHRSEAVPHPGSQQATAKKRLIGEVRWVNTTLPFGWLVSGGIAGVRAFGVRWPPGVVSLSD